MTGGVYDEEDGKTVEIEFVGDPRQVPRPQSWPRPAADISVTFKDGTTQTMAWDMWRHVANQIVGMTEMRARERDNPLEKGDRVRLSDQAIRNNQQGRTNPHRHGTIVTIGQWGPGVHWDGLSPNSVTVYSPVLLEKVNQ